MENLHVLMKTRHSQYKKTINKIPRFLGVPLRKVVRETGGRAGGEVPWGPRAPPRPTLGPGSCSEGGTRRFSYARKEAQMVVILGKIQF